MDWKDFPIYLRDDNTFVISKSGLPYHVPNEGEYQELYQEVREFALNYPDKVQIEPKPVIIDEPKPEPITFEDLKQDAKDRLKEYRQEMEYSGFMLNGQKWDSEQKDELRLNSAYKLFEETGMESYPDWKISDGVYIDLTLEKLKEATIAMSLHYSKCFSVEKAKLAEIDAIETEEELLAWLDEKLTVGWE